MKELDLIASIRPFCNDKLLDDAAIIGKQAITTDILVEGTHFTKETSYQDLGERAIAVNLSDLAAMGAQPKQILISLVTPSSVTTNNIEDFYQAAAKLCEEYNCKIIGGDMAQGTTRTVNVVAIGEKNTRFLKRTDLKLDDEIYVTGKLGSGIKHNYQNKVKPRVQEGLLLAKNKQVHACTDISDGLAKSAWEMAQVNNELGILIENIPTVSNTDDALYGGEDYELIFSCEAGTKLPFPTYYIGKVVSKQKATKFSKLGFDHFS